MNKNVKIIAASVYVVCFIFLIYVVFSYVDLKDLTDYSFLKSNSELIQEFKNRNLFLISILFFLFSVFWIVLLGFASPLAIIFGYVFGAWYGTFLSITSFAVGCTLLYFLANSFFKEIINKYLANKISKIKNKFNENEFLYFMLFRFTGGAGIPFGIQNILPVLFNMKIKNYFFASLIGLLPTVFIINSLGAGLENIISNNNNFSYMQIISSPSIYWPLICFFSILIIAAILKKKIFK
ncbi:VTT domain-containing protein [Pelagibacteraceae bacterium]|nr:VTT domain-containing protein [Pelagibacteraceae bacterium]